MTTLFLVDGMLSGTGVRNAVDGGFVALDSIGLSVRLSDDIATWQRKYEEAHFAGFPVAVVTALDEEGLALAARMGGELGTRTVGYFSDGRMVLLT